MNENKLVKINNRDKTIDGFRGFAMIWVIFVHVLYWGNFFTNEYINLIKSFCLFEMPLFFFITGASNSLSKEKSYIKFIYKRFKKCLIPYWIFAFICALLSICKYSIEENINFYIGIKVLLSWFIPINHQMTSISYLTWALWFIPVYLCVVLIIPILKYMSHSKRKYEFGLLLLIIFFVINFFKINEGLQKIIFYSFWTYVGLFYNNIKVKITQTRTRKYLWSIVAIMIVVIYVFYLVGWSIDMQFNKFPPNTIFLVFSIFMMSLIILAIPFFEMIFTWIEKSNSISKIFDLYSLRSMTIFLYQVFAFNLTIRITNLLFPAEKIVFSFIKSVFCLLTTILICSWFAIIFGRFEEVRNKT